MSSPLVRYESFLLRNGSTIASIESSLRSLTWFLPGRFKDADLASEALAAVLNLTSLYHDTLIHSILRANPKFKPLIPPSPHSRYTRAWAEKDARYKWASRFLEIVKYVELVTEMGLRRKVSRENRWRGVVLLEMIKSLLRLMILRITRRPLVSPPIPERDFDPANIPPLSDPIPSQSMSEPSASTPAHLQNNHISVDSTDVLSNNPLQSDSPVEDYLLPKALSTSSVRTPTFLLRPLSTPFDWLSEMLYIFRPLVYVGALSVDPHSPNPLYLSLALEFLSRYWRRKVPPSSALERAEYARRDRDILWYLFRGPIWQTFTRPKLDALADKTANAPILGLISAVIRSWVPLIDEYYYYTAT